MSNNTSPLVAMTEAEQACFDMAMQQWRKSLNRPDLSEQDRVKGALLAYQRQAFAFDMLARATTT